MNSIPMKDRFQAVTASTDGGIIRKTVFVNMTPEECGPACQAIRKQRKEQEKQTMQQKTREQIRAVVRGEVERALSPVTAKIRSIDALIKQSEKPAARKSGTPRGIVVSGGNSGGQFKPKY